MEQTNTIIAALSSGLPILLMQFVIALVLHAIGVFVYMRITPYNDFALIRDGNIAAGTALSGIVLAMALPLYAILSHHQATLDVLVWGIVAILLQIIVTAVAMRAVKDLRHMIVANNVAAALALSAVQIAVAMINAGLMSAD